MAEYRVDYAYCAGVLPYTDFNNNTYFLMGKSRKHGRLVTFSGKNEHLDDSIEHTAAREFYEETLGSVMDKASALTAVRRSSIVLESRTPRNMPCYTFLIHIPYRRLYAIAFHKTKEFLQEINVRAYEFHEMCDIKWVCSRSMLDKIRKQWERTGCLKDSVQWEKVERLCARPSSDKGTWRSTATDGSDTDAASEIMLNSH